ncbi:hypothetical protein D3C83_217520 [compost metagenome]
MWVLSEGRLRRQTVEAGARSGDRVVIRSGLLGGEAVVVTDSPDLAEGRSARTVEKAG